VGQKREWGVKQGIPSKSTQRRAGRINSRNKHMGESNGGMGGNETGGCDHRPVHKRERWGAKRKKAHRKITKVEAEKTPNQKLKKKKGGGEETRRSPKGSCGKNVTQEKTVLCVQIPNKKRGKRRNGGRISRRETKKGAGRKLGIEDLGTRGVKQRGGGGGAEGGSKKGRAGPV